MATEDIENRTMPAVYDPKTGKLTSRGRRVIPREFYDENAGEITPPPPPVVEEPKPKTREELLAGPDIPGTISYGGDISNFGAGAPGYTPPTLTAEDEARQAEIKAAAEQRKNALDVLAQRYAQYGLTGLVDVIRKLAIEGASEATITFALQETPEYKTRFKANEIRLRKGLAVLEPKEYIAVEDSYRQILRTYGLNVFDNDAYVSKFIENDVSPTELNARVQLASQRIINANPQIKNTLSNYYGIADTDLVAYVLDPSGQLPNIEKQISAAEIGTAASRQGFNIGAGTAEYLTGLGVTQEQALKGYGTIAEVLPTAQKLTDIYKDGLEGYGLEEAQGEVFGQLASQKRKREKLAAAEVAAFTGRTGVNQLSLGGPSSAGLI